jgi:tRNA(Ile)-lysidine synthase TilS/MesJ
MGVPFIAYGWSPGQAPIPSSVLAMNVSMIRQQQEFLKKLFYSELGEDLRAFLLHERHYRLLETAASTKATSPLYNIHPLAFFDYDEEKVLEEIKALGWVSPEDTDSNSTNCLLNSFAIQLHMNEWGFHPYAMEIASLVRDGYMTREQGLDKLMKAIDEKTISFVKDKLAKGA